MRKSNKIIVGSGLAGPLLAIYLSQRGHAVDLFEKRPDIRKENISVGRSINLALSHRGIKALKSADAFDQIEPILIPMKGRMVHLLDGEIKFQPYSVHSNEYINSVSRGKLNKILMSKATTSGKVKIYFNHSLLKIDEINKELIFKNGARVPITKYVFGADGAFSAIRKYIDGKVSLPSYTDPLGHDYKELHIAPGIDGDFQLEPNALHIWPREEFMLIALPNIDKSFTCTLFLPVDGDINFNVLSTPEAVVDFFNDYFEEVLPLLENFPNTFFDKPIGKLATVYAYEWQYNNQYCLTGDAAHAVVPFFGQGMNASFEDCEVLMQYLDESPGNWDGVFKKYSSARKVDSDAIAKMALENYVEMRDLVTQKEFLQQKEIANYLSKRFPDRFIPRYNMVSFTSIPYSEVYKRGNIQKEIISTLDLSNPDFAEAESMIKNLLPPLV